MYTDSCTPSDRGQSGIRLYTVCTLTAARRATEASRVSGCTLYVHWQLTPSDRGQSGIRLYAVCTLTANAERQRPVGYQAVHCMYTDSCTPSDRGQSGIRLYTVCTLTAARRATEASRVSGCTLYVHWQLHAERQRPVGYQAVHCMYTDSCTPSDRGQSGIRLYTVCTLTANAERQRPVGYQAVRCMYTDS